MYHGKPKIQFQINSYLRLADLCGPDEQDKKAEYMEKVESLLLELEDSSYSVSAPMKSSVQSFLKEHGEDDLNDSITAQVYKAYKEYCAVNNFHSVSNIEFSRQICGITGMRTKDVRIAGIKMKMFVPKPESGDSYAKG